MVGTLDPRDWWQRQDNQETTSRVYKQREVQETISLTARKKDQFVIFIIDDLIILN